MENPLYIILPIFFVAFPLFFIGVIFLISRMGWRKLAAQFEYTHQFDGEKIKLTSAGIGLSNYNNVLNTYVNREGIYMRPRFVFKLFHPAVMIPWKEFRDYNEGKMWFVNTATVLVGHDPQIKITFAGKSAKIFTEVYNNYSNGKSGNKKVY